MYFAHCSGIFKKTKQKNNTDKEVDASVLERHLRVYRLKAAGISLNIQEQSKL